MWGILSNKILETAMTLKISWPVDNCAIGRRVESGRNGYGTKHWKPFVWNARSLSKSMCWTRWSVDSIVPKSIVQLLGNPISCAVWWMSMYSWLDSFPLQITALIPSSRISAPPPGREVRPAFLSCNSVSLIDRFDNCARCFTSTAVSALIDICGCSERIRWNNWQ